MEAREHEQIEEIYNNYVLPRSLYDYSAFWRAMHTEERDHWGRWWLEIHTPALDRERCLVALLLREKIISWNLGRKSKNARNQIKELTARYHEIGKELKIIIESDIWEKYNIRRPDVSSNAAKIWIEEARDIV